MTGRVREFKGAIRGRRWQERNNWGGRGVRKKTLLKKIKKREGGPPGEPFVEGK